MPKLLLKHLIIQILRYSYQTKKKTPEKFALFQAACKAHIAYISKASDGHGCDRHLLGLKLCLKQGERHEFFDHPVFSKSSKWQLSTSGLFAADGLYGTGFGTVVSACLTSLLVSRWIWYELCLYSCKHQNWR